MGMVHSKILKYYLHFQAYGIFENPNQIQRLRNAIKPILTIWQKDCLYVIGFNWIWLKNCHPEFIYRMKVILATIKYKTMKLYDVLRMHTENCGMTHITNTVNGIASRTMCAYSFYIASILTQTSIYTSIRYVQYIHTTDTATIQTTIHILLYSIQLYTRAHTYTHCAKSDWWEQFIHRLATW